MKKLAGKIGKWILRILLGIVSLLVLIVLVFYLFRGNITRRVVDYINDQQPGELSLEKMNLSPFLGLPDVSIRLRNVTYRERSQDDVADNIPVLEMDDISVSLDVVELIRGRYVISKVRLGDGELNYLVGSDSVSNVERALGIRFGEEATPDTTEKTPVKLDLESLEMRNFAVHYNDIPANASVELMLNGLESGFSYDPERITATVMLHAEISGVRMKDLNIEKPRTISFSSSVKYNLEKRQVLLERSMVDFAGAIFEMNGNVDVGEGVLDMEFAARNSGIELLNFLLSGVLDLDAIEQIGEGRISVNGTASGSYKNSMPLLNVDISATDMGFRIQRIGQDITEIGFMGSFTNGTKKDLSEASLNLRDFHVRFPKGALDAQVSLANLVTPSVDIEWNGNADLSLINEIIETRQIRKMKGDLRFEGGIDGVIDKSSGTFLKDAGALSVFMKNVSISLPENEITDLHGELYAEEKYAGIRNVSMQLDNNSMEADFQLENFLPYLMDFSVVPGAMVKLQSDTLNIERVIGDTIFRGPVTDLGFRLDVTTDAGDFKQLINPDSRLPDLRIFLQNFHAAIPGFPPISRVKGAFNIRDSVIDFSSFRGKIGGSDFDIDGVVGNYNAFLKKDSAATIYTRLKIESDKLKAADLPASPEDKSMTSTQFAQEEIRDFIFKVNIETTVSDLLNYNGLPNIKIVADQLSWRLKNYPEPFTGFSFDIEKSDTLFMVNHFSGQVGDSDFELKSRFYHLFDSVGNRHGELTIMSDLLDIDRLTDYQQGGRGDSISQPGDTVTTGRSVGLEKINYPDLDVTLDIRELRVEDNIFRDMNGAVRLKPYKVVYFDRFSVSSESGGVFSLEGQFNVSDPEHYILSTRLKIDTINVSDFDVPFAIGDSIYSLEENFNGILSAEGLAEFFINPDLSLNIDLSTAMFYVTLEQGRVKNFAPLNALSRFTGKKELTNLKFGKLSNPRGFTLSDGKIDVPLMKIESTVGVILLEGTQYLNGDFLYLARAPWDLVKETAWNLLTGPQKGAEEEEVKQMETQKFMPVTIYSKDGETEVKRKDRRDQYKLR